MFSKNELDTPEWLNEQFLQKVLKDHKSKKSVKVNKVNISTSPEAHFASIIFKIDVRYECEGTGKGERSNFILKTVPVEEGVKKDFLKNSSAFPTEMRMYEEIIPKMEAILRDKGDTRVFAPE